MKVGSLLLLALATYLAAGFRPAYPPNLCQNRVNYFILSYAPDVKPAAEACYEGGILVAWSTSPGTSCAAVSPARSSAVIVFALL